MSNQHKYLALNLIKSLLIHLSQTTFGLGKIRYHGNYTIYGDRAGSGGLCFTLPVGLMVLLRDEVVLQGRNVMCE